MSTLSLTLNTAEPRPQKVEPYAYYMLLKGLQPLRENTLEDNLQARERFKRALALNPDYARAHPNIRHAYYAIGQLNLGLNEYDNALAAARHALNLNSNYVDGYALLVEAEFVLEKAFHNNPHYQKGLFILLANYGALGKKEQSESILKILLEYDQTLDAGKIANQMTYRSEKRSDMFLKQINKLTL